MKMSTRKQQEQQGGRSTWFERRRDHFLCQMVMDFFSFTQAFFHLYGEYLACGRLESGRMRMDLLASRTAGNRQRIWRQLARMIGSENEKGELWRLKDLCHQLWPGQDQDGSVHGALLDWLVGSVFHEAMKLKENIYLLNTYGPAARRLRRLSPRDSALPRLSAMVNVESLVGSIAGDAARQVEHLAVLVGQASCILRILLPELAENHLLVRLLVEEENQVRTIWGEEVDAVLEDMFQGAAAHGFCAAGRSYRKGQWYERARAMYGRALQCDPENREARRQLARLKTMPAAACPDSGQPGASAGGRENVSEPSII